MDIQFPTDSAGVTFDPALHNLLDEPARPELSKTGKFVKARGNDGNEPELIARYVESLKYAAETAHLPKAPDGVIPTDEAAPVKPSKAKRLTPHEIAVQKNATVLVHDGDEVVFEKNGIRIAVNLANYSTDEALLQAVASL